MRSRNFLSNPTKLGLSVATFLTATVILLAIMSNLAMAESRDMPVNGHLTSQLVTEGCTSPVGICTAGSLIGGIQGDFDFTATSLIPSSLPSVFLYTGTIVVHTKDGDLFITDAGAFDTVGDGPVVDLSTITGGTGEFAGASGYIEIFGTFTFAEGGDSDYRGKIITP